MALQQSLTYIEIDVPHCSLTYGVAPCTASLTNSPPTGTIKCFNSLGTCQDKPNFTDAPVTMRFAEDIGFLPTDIEAYPFIKTVDFTAAIVSLGGDLGQRATLKVVFRDAQHSDAGDTFDKYPADRDYDDPFNRGTFWGKFRARNPFLRSRPIRLIRGTVGQSLAEMETRHYIIESIDGPTTKGEFTITGKDVLKLADSDRAVAPALSNGFLVGAINTVVTSVTLSPSGIGNAEYPASGFAALGGSEIVSFTRAGDVLAITRAQLNTEAKTHDVGDRVQLVLRYSGEDGADIISDLLLTYAGVDPDFIPLAAWQAETAAFLARVYTLNVAEPTSVNSLISEMLMQMGGALWWDDVNQIIRLQILRAVATTADRYNEDNVMEGTLAVKEQPEKRVSRIIVYFGQINPLKKVDDLDNYRSSEQVVDEQSEEDEGSAAIKTIFARGVAAGGRTVATRMGELHLSRYVRPPRRLNFDLMRYAGQSPLLGTGYRLGGGSPFQESWPFQDETGARVDVPIQITRLDPDAGLYHLEAEEMLFTAYGGDVDPTNRVIIFDANENSVNLRARHDELYPTPVSGDVVTAYVNAGVIIGSTSTAIAALDIGSWPAGVTVTLVIAGRIEGRGGDGGFGGIIFANGLPGGSGGPALYTRFAIALQLDSGEIWGGGGGGGGGGASSIGSGAGGGGGGAGQLPGTGGGSTSGGARIGLDGTTETAGSGGIADFPNGNGGAGGNPGLAGFVGGNPVGSGSSPGAGGAAGSAIDGVSFVTPSGSGDIRGAQIN